ncbi:MAG: metallophosphoesterase, partial [Pseudomonadota bacterium]
MKIVQLSDIHFGVEDRGALALAGSVIESSEPDALIICGDLTQRGKRSEFAAAREWIDGFSRPTLVVPGNHDTPLLNMVERVTSPFDR